MLIVKYSNEFKKDYKIAKRRGLNIKLLNEVVEMLANKEELPLKYRDHSLNGKYKGYRECHIQPNWLLIYQKNDKELVLTLVRTGTHSDLLE